MKLSPTLVSVLLVTGAVSLSGQQPAPPPVTQDAPLTFRVEVNYVEIDAVVTDAQGNLVKDLSPNDFELLEDGKAQTVSAFSLVNIPVERLVRPLFAASAIEPDVQTNTGAEGRMYLILLDSLHTAPANAFKVKAAARKFVQENLGANDLAAVVFSRGNSDAAQDFTSSKRLLLQAIDRFVGQKLPGSTVALTQEVNSRIGRQPGDPVSDANLSERAFNARNVMNQIRTLAEFMAGVRGRRKAMLLFSEGTEYNYGDILANTQATGVLESVRDAVGVATRANVALYTIDPRGLANPDADLIFAPNNVGADDRSLGDLGSRSIAREFKQSQDSLRELAEDTGGFAVLNQNEFTTAFQRIVDDNSSYYVLGYYSTNERRDGRFRSITVRLKRPGLQVRYRKGYIAPRGRAPETALPRPGVSPLVRTAFETMASPIAVRGIPMRVFATPIKGEAPNAIVALAIEMDVNTFNFTETDGAFNDRIELILSAIDVAGKQRANTTHAVNLAMKPDTLERAKREGVRVLSQLAVPPGRYQFRIAVAEAGGKTASVIADVEVPDFYKPALVMSGLALTANAALETITVAPNDPLATFLPAPLSARREFSSSDTLALFAEFYENLPANTPPHKVDVTTTIRADDGRVLSRSEEEMESADLTRGRGGFGFTTRIPLNSLSPGLYVIRVEGHSRATRPEDVVGRDVQIQIR